MKRQRARPTEYFYGLTLARHARPTVHFHFFLCMFFKRGKQGKRGKPGKGWKRGKPGKQGKRGKRGTRGTWGKRGKRGKWGKRPKSPRSRGATRYCNGGVNHARKVSSQCRSTPCAPNVSPGQCVWNVVIWSKAVCVTSYGRMFSEFPRREIRGFVLTACKLPSFRALNFSVFPRGNAAFSFEAGRFQCSTLVQHVFFGERCLYTRYCSTHFLTFQFMYGLGSTGSTAIYFRFAWEVHCWGNGEKTDHRFTIIVDATKQFWIRSGNHQLDGGRLIGHCACGQIWWSTLLALKTCPCLTARVNGQKQLWVKVTSWWLRS